MVLRTGPLTIGLLSLVFASINLFAQYTTGRIEGIVFDSSGGVLKNVEVTAKDLQTNSTRRFITGPDGIYAFPAVAPGSYELRAEVKGFASVTSRVITYVSQITSQNFVLAPGEQSASINVVATGGMLSTRDGQLSVTRAAAEISNLPNLGRNAATLASLEPGVQPTFNPRGGSLTIISGAQAGPIAANGGRARSSAVQLDYTDANDWEFGGFALGTQPNPEMLGEFKVITNSFPAEYGVKSNAEIIMVTKSGTNQFHGSAYDYLQNNALNARDYFDRTGRATPIKKNDYGFTAGMPIVRNKTFLFGGWDESKTRGAGFTLLASVPSESARASVTDPAVARLIKQYLPESASLTADPKIATVASQFGSPSNANQAITKIDRYFGETNVLSGRYWYSKGLSVLSFPSYNSLAGFDSNFDFRSQSLNLTDTWFPNSRTTNELRFAYGRSSALLLTQSDLAGPRFAINGLVNFGALNFFPQGRVFNVYQVNDSVTRVLGAHTLKAGFDLRRIQDNSTDDTNRRGFFSFGSLDSFLAGQPNLYTQVVGDTYRGFRTGLYGFFAQDDWKATPSLTLNLGVRWEVQGALNEAHSQISELNAAMPGTIGGAGSGPLGSFRMGNPGVDQRPFNIGPRIGFAWNPGQRNLVVRGGYGIVYDSFAFTPLANSRTGPPLNYTVSLTGANISGLNNLAGLLNGSAPFLQQANDLVGSFGQIQNFGSLTAVERALKNPYAQQFNANLEYQLSPSVVVSLGYVGTKGTHLTRVDGINPLIVRPQAATSLADETARLPLFLRAYNSQNNPAGNGRLDARFNQVNLIGSNSNSIYHSLQTDLRKRLSRGITLQASYTWSKSIDDASDFNIAQQANDYSFSQDYTNRGEDRAVSNFDVTHRILVTGIWQIPFFHNLKGVKRNLFDGWSFQSINQWQSGIPATILAGARYGVGDVNLDGNLASGATDNTRANCLAGGTGFHFGDAASVPPLAARGFNGRPDSASFAYRQPLLGNNGTCGRNTFRMNGLTNSDWAFTKDIRLIESGALDSGPWNLQFRTELFNVFNTPFLTATGDAWRTISSPSFGLYNSAGAARRIQLALKLVW